MKLSVVTTRSGKEVSTVFILFFIAVKLSVVTTRSGWSGQWGGGI